MKTNGFTFKRFHVRQDGAAMKVTTDACVFGAWIKGPAMGRVLDAGTGTGLLALMLAQRFDQLEITGVELEESAFRDAVFNFSQSPFANRLRAVHSDIGCYVHECSFDAVVCNPPFFLNSLPSGDKPRKMARHVSDVFSVDGFLDAVTRLLRMDGKLFLMLPPVEAKVWLGKAAERRIYPVSICCLRHDRMRRPHRLLIEMNRQQDDSIPPCVESELHIIENGSYSEQMRGMLSPFYLHLD